MRPAVPDAALPASLPTAEQVSHHLQRHRPGPLSPWVARGPLLALVVAVVLSLVLPGLAGALLPWLAVMAVLVHAGLRLRAARALQLEATAVGEQAVLRRYRRALRRGWELLPRVAGQPMLHGQVVAAMARCLDDLGAREAAMVAYDHLLSGMPESGPATMRLRICRAIAALRTDHLADGDEAIRKVRGAIGPYLGTPVGGAFRLAQLIQDVRTCHYADALEFEPDLLDDLRPLGVEAGFGYGLMALCLRLSRPVDSSEGTDPRAAADLWWDRATTLLPVECLVGEFPELAAIAFPGGAER